ncbi:MAG: hypothetical protein AB1486_06820 [Planctomycetota bacterium]
MRLLITVTLILGCTPLVVRAGDSATSTQNETLTDGQLEQGWVVSIPSGGSDYFNVRYDGLAGRPLRGVSVGTADFGSATSYPIAGLFDSNLTLDPSGETPDLSSGRSVGPVAPAAAPFDYVYASFSGLYYPAAEPQHVVVQMPPGDPGLLGIGADSNLPLQGFSGWTADGYDTPAYTGAETWGLNANIDAVVELNAQGNDGRLRWSVSTSDETGDLLAVDVVPGDSLALAFFAPQVGTSWIVFSSVSGSPVARKSTVIATIADPPGAYRRLGITWPSGLGSLSLTFVAVSGIVGVSGTVGISNEITLTAREDLGDVWGIKDDGSYEHGLIIQIPTGSADFFNVNFNPGQTPVVSEITDFELAVMDFGTTSTAFPLSAVCPANTTLDPSAMTPDLSQPYEAAPLTFPAGVFATTSAVNVVRTFSTPIPYSSVQDDNVHGVVQLPPGDFGLLAVGIDTSSTLPSGSAWSVDGYVTPAYPFSYKLGLRLGSR